MYGLIERIIAELGVAKRVDQLDLLGMDAHVSKRGRDHDSDMYLIKFHGALLLWEIQERGFSLHDQVCGWAVR